MLIRQSVRSHLFYLKLCTLSLAVLLLNACTKTSNNQADKPVLEYFPSQELLIEGQTTEIPALENTTVTLSPIAHDDLWQRVRDGFQFDPDLDNARIKAQRDWYARNQQYLNRVVERASRYLYYIVEEAENKNLPLELVLLPVVESAFDPFAYSHGRASGAWQFIPSTGKIFKLKQNWWYDGRRDITESTRAALEYLDLLQGRFDGNWLHALASYNSGSGTVKKAIRRNKKLGRTTDFWSLKLPRETRAYVPKLLAIAQIIKDPKKYGVTLPAIKNKPRFEIVDIDSQIDLAQAARLAEMPLNELYLFNPGFNRWATAPEGPHKLVIPLEYVEAFKKNLALLPSSERVQWVRYKIKSGDSLGVIANKHHITTSLLKQVNSLRSNTIRAGATLLIPKASEALASYGLSSNQRTLAKQNAPKAGKEKVNYTVKPGDSIWSIAKIYKVSMRELARWNAMAPTDPLKIGQKLAVWTNATLTQSDASTAGIQMNRKVNYKVRRGDSLSRIASKFNVTVSQIKRWNAIDSKKYIQPGQRLVVYIDIRNTYY